MPTWIWLLVILIAVFIDFILMGYLKRRGRGQTHENGNIQVLGVYSPILTWLRSILQKKPEGKDQIQMNNIQSRISWLGKKRFPTGSNAHLALLYTTAEILIVILWGLLIAKPYLNFDEDIIPTGNEYPSAIQTHHLWTRLSECGLCAMWNGSTRGGAPYFVDPHGSMLHPLVIFTTLGWGVQNGAKLALAGAFILAGLAQWWLAFILGLGRPARLWSSLMAAAGGHLAVRMELGAFGVVLSLVMCALVLPPLILLLRTTSRRSAVLLGIFLALAILAGQGYMQIGLLMSTIPAAVFLVPVWDREYLKRLFSRILLAGLIAILLSAPFLVPMLHFMPQFDKEMDRDFGSAQSFEYIPLNLVIRDPDFLRNDSLAKLPYPHLNGNYIGWLTVLLALYTFSTKLNSEHRRTAYFLLISAVLALWVASAVPLIWIIQISPFQAIDDFIAGIRNPAQIAGLAGVSLIGLAGMGLDHLLKSSWLQFQFGWVQGQSPSRLLKIDARWLLIIPLTTNLLDVQGFGRGWIGVTRIDPTVLAVNLGLRTPTLEWVNPPFGEHMYIESAVGMGLKTATGIRTWYWRGRNFPKPFLEANHAGQPPDMQYYQEAYGMPIYIGSSDREYAKVIHNSDSTTTICQATGNSGDIDVSCSLSKPGMLVVKENSWSGWHVKVDGISAKLKSDIWLSVELLPGDHKVEFRYRPWDVPLGVLLSILGLLIAAAILLSDRSAQINVPKEKSGDDPSLQTNPDSSEP